jgi:hypothetical protein
MAPDAAVVEAPVETTPPPAVDWSAHVPKEYETVFAPYKGKPLGEVFKGYGEASKMIGARPQGVKIPDEKSTPEERAAFHKALGVPESPDKYEVKRPEAALDGMWDETAEKTFLAEMHAVGAPPTIVNAAMKWYGGFIASQQAAVMAQQKAIAAQLRTEWGPNYDAKLGRANRAILRIGGDALMDHYIKTRMDQDPQTIKAWAEIGELLVEGGAMTTDGPDGLTAEDATAEIAKIRTDKTHALYAAFNDPNHRDHSKALDHLQSLYAIKNRGQAAE